MPTDLNMFDKFHFVEVHIFGKDDFKCGDIVTLRNGDKLVYGYDESFHDLDYSQVNPLTYKDDLDENLNYRNANGKRILDYGVIKVERPTIYKTKMCEHNSEPIELTIEEIEARYGRKVKIVESYTDEDN